MFKIALFSISIEAVSEQKFNYPPKKNMVLRSKGLVKAVKADISVLFDCKSAEVRTSGPSAGRAHLFAAGVLISEYH